jgi:phage gpG-like protein
VFRFRLDIAGEIQMDRGIAHFADGVADYRPIWPVIEDDFYALEKDQFKTEGAEGGERWKELSEGYAYWKEKEYPGKPILERTGDLKKSLTSPNDPNTVRIEERKTLTLGTRIPYAIYHQSIEPRTSNLPRRPEIMLTEEFKRTVMHHVQTYLVQIASQSGFRQGMGPLNVSSMAAGFVRKGGGVESPWGRIAGF